MTYYGDMVKTCLQCTLSFDSKRANKNYCSTKCSNRAAYKRKPKKVKPIWEAMSSEELFAYFAIPWTERQKELYDVDRKSFEGRGEKSRRDALGLPLEISATSPDIPKGETNDSEEIKGVDSYDKKGRYRLNTQIRLGQRLEETAFGKAFSIVVLASRFVEGNEELITDPTIIEDFERLAPKAETIARIPEPHRTKVMDLLRFSKVMNADFVTLVSKVYGYLRIPASDYDEAFNFTCVSQSRLNYRLNLNYLRKRVRIVHEQNKERDHVLRNGCGEDLGQLPSSDPVSSPVSGPGHMGNSEGAHQPERVTGGLCQERDVRRDGDPGEPLTENDSCDLSLQGREEDCRRVFSDPFEW